MHFFRKSRNAEQFTIREIEVHTWSGSKRLLEVCPPPPTIFLVSPTEYFNERIVEKAKRLALTEQPAEMYCVGGLEDDSVLASLAHTIEHLVVFDIVRRRKNIQPVVSFRGKLIGQTFLSGVTITENEKIVAGIPFYVRKGFAKDTEVRKSVKRVTSRLSREG